MFKFIKRLNNKIDNWFCNALPKNSGIRPEECFAFKDDAEKDEIHDEILDNRLCNAASGLKWMILAYLIAILFLTLSSYF